VGAWSTFDEVFADRTGVVRGEVFACAPTAGGVIGAAEGVVAKELATGALGEMIETEAAFQAKCRREGRQAGSLSDVLCLGASDGDDDGGGRFSFAFVI
jgi:hypothetical protein